MSRTDQFVEQWLPIIGESVVETFQMVSISLFFSVLIGIPLGILIVLTRPGQALANKFIYQLTNLIINIVRSIPFIILLFFILPFTKLIVGNIVVHLIGDKEQVKNAIHYLEAQGVSTEELEGHSHE